RMLCEMATNGCRYAAMEVSSHGLQFGRVLGLQLRYALFSNLSQDHLDFHGDMESYFLAKQKQFDHLVEGGVAVINIDDAYGRRLHVPERARLIRYGTSPEADLQFVVNKLDVLGGNFTLSFEGKSVEFQIPLIGKHNIYNYTAAAAVALCEGRTLADLAATAHQIAGVPGRTEMLNLGQDFGVVVDFAHTPDALVNVLTACATVATGRLITVFGAGGDRDHTKRPEMGAAVERLSDVIYLTSDNPRTEDPELIMDMVQAGMKRAPGKDFIRDWDRRRAIESALNRAESGDLVVIAGRGHETYQDIDGKLTPFDDRVVASRFIQARLERLSNV
ncbi:MAG: UDP-N-acetylmuramoyl-L-alanyl-D-glutamate--2,6-diaminopimelate ligase, partial [Acidobacteriota bacterium]|nr:UDP-N-acetylmuramoyl-L-alanyl-D-glutamate--2,6-diaminopimelate ligase [Acidobacteriota bacterium]